VAREATQRGFGWLGDQQPSGRRKPTSSPLTAQLFNQLAASASTTENGALRGRQGPGVAPYVQPGSPLLFSLRYRERAEQRYTDGMTCVPEFSLTCSFFCELALPPLLLHSLYQNFHSLL
jgi:hypothetical protein